MKGIWDRIRQKAERAWRKEGDGPIRLSFHVLLHRDNTIYQHWPNEGRSTIRKLDPATPVGKLIEAEILKYKDRYARELRP